MFVACGIWCLADVSSVSPSSEQTKHNSPVCSDEGLTLETSAKHHIPQATNIPYQPYSDWVCTAVISNDVMKDLRGGYAI